MDIKKQLSSLTRNPLTNDNDSLNELFRRTIERIEELEKILT